MVIRTSFRGLVIWFVAAGVLALAGLGLASSETDARCEEFGFVVKDAYTCEASDGLRLAYFFGGNCLLAGLSIGWSLFKRARANGQSLGSVFAGAKSAGWLPAGDRIFYGSSSVNMPTGNWSVGQPSRIHEKRKERASEYESPSFWGDIGADINEGPAPQAQEGQIVAEPPTIEAGPQVNAIGNDEPDFLTSGFRLSPFPRAVDERDIENCLSVVPSGFEVSQASLTASHLASRLATSELRCDVDGLKLMAFFRAGLQIAHKGYGLPLMLPSVIDAPPEERLTFLEAISEDSQFFMDIDDSQIEAAFLLLPVPVRYWFHRKVEEEGKGSPLSVLHTCFLRMFICGVAYVAFQASDAS